MSLQMGNHTRQPTPVGRHPCIPGSQTRRGCANCYMSSPVLSANRAEVYDTKKESCYVV